MIALEFSIVHKILQRFFFIIFFVELIILAKCIYTGLPILILLIALAIIFTVNGLYRLNDRYEANEIGFWIINSNKRKCISWSDVKFLRLKKGRCGYYSGLLFTNSGRRYNFSSYSFNNYPSFVIFLIEKYEQKEIDILLNNSFKKLQFVKRDKYSPYTLNSVETHKIFLKNLPANIRAQNFMLGMY